MITSRAFLLCLCLLCLSPLSQACSCAGTGPACSEAVHPENVAIFVGTVVSIAEAQPPTNPQSGGMLEVTLAVEEPFKGVTTKEISITTDRSEAACGFPFEKGQKYLVYASEYERKLYTSICQRTMSIRYAEKDLKYLRAFESAPLTGSIFGSYKKYTFDPNFVPKFTPSIMDHSRPPEEEYRAMAPMMGETVTVISEGGDQRRVKVDNDGNFLFNGLPPGKYKIEVSVPPNLSPPIGYPSGLRSSINDLEVVSKGCEEVTFRTQPDGHLSGRILNKDGSPLTNVQVTAWSTADKFNFYQGYRVFNKEDGSYDIGPLPPGEYILGAYVWVLAQGFPNMAEDRDKLTKATLRFFPSAASRDSASKITVSYGEHVTAVDFHLSFDPAQWKDVKASK